MTLAASLAGCAALPFVENPIDMVILNRHDEPHELAVEAIHLDGDREYSEALELSESYEVPVRNDRGPRSVREEDVLPSGSYLVRAEVDGEWTRNYHYFPDCTGNDSSESEPEDEFHIEINRAGTDMVFKQAYCSPDSPMLQGLD